jgi:hypothetical protein
MNGTVFAVMLMVCSADGPCTEANAHTVLKGQFVNPDSKTPCEDWLFAQLGYNATVIVDATNMTMHFVCKPKEK